jgi:hypothetical protein
MTAFVVRSQRAPAIVIGCSLSAVFGKDIERDRRLLFLRRTSKETDMGFGFDGDFARHP